MKALQILKNIENNKVEWQSIYFMFCYCGIELYAMYMATIFWIDSAPDLPAQTRCKSQYNYYDAVGKVASNSTRSYPLLT